MSLGAAPPVSGRPAAAGGVTVHTTGALVPARDRAVADAVSGRLAEALTRQDASLWGTQAAAEAALRLGWLDLPSSSRALLPRLRELREQLVAEGLDHIVLAGMGGSSLAPEVITATAGVELTVLDTTDPHQVLAALGDRLDRTVIVVSSKSGGTVETDSHRRIYAEAFVEGGLSRLEAHRRIVVVTDPGSPLQDAATREGYRAVFLADPNVGGRYSALSAFGLVPSALAGVDVARLLDEAQALGPALAESTPDNPGLALGAALGAGGAAGQDKVVLADAGSGIVGFGDWAEQLIAESTGKQGRGLLPVVTEDVGAPGFAPGPDVHLVTLTRPDGVPPGGRPGAAVEGTWVGGALGAQFLLWEYAVAVAGRLMSINPFDQPNVAESKANTTQILDAAGGGPLPEAEPALVEGDVAVYADQWVLAGAGDLATALTNLLAAVPARGYLAVMAYLDRLAQHQAARLRPLLAGRLAHPVTFGWGPRFLHSTGQYHKGGPQVGVYLQLTGASRVDIDVPGRPFGLARLQSAQALGDLRALASRGRPVLRVHLLDRSRGLDQLLQLAGGSAWGVSAAATGPAATGPTATGPAGTPR